jgi:hypothetical protein
VRVEDREESEPVHMRAELLLLRTVSIHGREGGVATGGREKAMHDQVSISSDGACEVSVHRGS